MSEFCFVFLLGISWFYWPTWFDISSVYRLKNSLIEIQHLKDISDTNLSLGATAVILETDDETEDAGDQSFHSEESFMIQTWKLK